MRLQSLPDAVGDLVGGESILPQDVGSLAGLAELIVDADLAELAADLAHEHVGHGVAQAADDAVLLHGDHIAAFSAHWVTQAASMGLMVWTLMTAMWMPWASSSLAAANVSLTIRPQANTAASVPSRRTLALPISKG